MIRWLRPLLAALLTLTAPGVMGATVPAAASSNDEDRQILVMLKMPAAHYRPNSSYSGDYGNAAGQAARKRSARRIAERYGVELRDGWPMPLLGVDCYVMLVPPGKALDEVIAAVAKEPGVAWAQRMTSYLISGKVGAAEDPLYSAQPTAGEWKLRELQRSATGRGVKIAIVDSRVDVAHPDLAGQFVSDENFIGGSPGRPEAHGTHVAGHADAVARLGADQPGDMGAVRLRPGRRA